MSIYITLELELELELTIIGESIVFIIDSDFKSVTW